jgi:hypothetical protein
VATRRNVSIYTPAPAGASVPAAAARRSQVNASASSRLVPTPRTRHSPRSSAASASAAPAAARSRCTADRYLASSRHNDGLPEFAYPLHDRQYMVTACGRVCMHRKKINLSTVRAGQLDGLKEVEDSIWLVGFVHDDLGYIDLEQKTLQPNDNDNPFGPRLSPMS